MPVQNLVLNLIHTRQLQVYNVFFIEHDFIKVIYNI